MPRKLRLAYFAHTLRSDWNNGNAHFLRGLLRAMVKLGHAVTAYEQDCGWSYENLRTEAEGGRSLRTFFETYSEIDVQTYPPGHPDAAWLERLRDVEVVIVHEWNSPELAQTLLRLRDDLGYKLLFHDTHHRASSSPEEMERFGLRRFDGVLAFGEALRRIYREGFGIETAWTLHEAADTTIFRPTPELTRGRDLIWVGNWGDGERSAEIEEFLLRPAKALCDLARTTLYGVRYPPSGLEALQQASVRYGGYLANLDAVRLYAQARATMHVPRQHYTRAMTGIPTIRVFEALACGIPLVSAPWQDTEGLFREGDFVWAGNATEMTSALRLLLLDPVAAEAQAERGLETILARHTCDHRAQELTSICEEVLR